MPGSSRKKDAARGAGENPKNRLHRGRKGAIINKHPYMEDEARAELISKFSGIITEDGGEIEGIDEWGKRRLAYPIDYINDGYYVLVNFKAKLIKP